MKAKSYTLPLSDGQTLTYGFRPAFRKWEFRHGNNSFLCGCHGQEQGHKVARIISGSVKRSGSIDNLARKNISQLTSGPKEV